MLTAFLVGFFTLLPARTALSSDVLVSQTEKVLGFKGSHDPIWSLKGTKPYLIGGYGDNFSYDGSRVVPIIGEAEVVLDAEKDRGTAKYTVYGTINPEKDRTYSGEITLIYRVGEGGPAFQEGGVADFIYMHGDTKQDAPVMPKSRTFLASWGKADIFVNGSIVYKDIMAHIMYTERTRNTKTQAIYNSDKSGFYSPKSPGDGSVADRKGRELHFVAHSMKEDRGNFPPHNIWIHLNFEDVRELKK